MTKQDQDRREDVERQINQLLHEGNYLPAGRDLCLITLHQNQTREGHVYTIRVEENPFLIFENLILKVGQRNHREIVFHKSAKEQQLPVQPCLAAKIDPDSGYTALLSADLSYTHTRLSDWNTQPPDPVLHRVVETVAQIQAFGWQQRQIGNLAVNLPSVNTSQQEHDEFVGWLKRDAEDYIQARQNRVPAKVVEIFTLAIHQLKAGWEQTWSWRIANDEHLSLVHGDLHPGNIFYPVDKQGCVCCIDWEAFRLDLPTTDFVMLLALHLAPHADQALPLLKTYHAALLQNGITNYPFQNLLNDYRSAILYGMFVPRKLFAFSRIINETMLDHVLTACESFHCLEGE